MRKPTSFLAVLLCAATLLVPLRTSAQSTTCPLGYTVAFFNGVGNSYGEAVASMEATQQAIRETQLTKNDVYDSEDVRYEVMYNTTAANGGSLSDPVNTTILQDIAEVFVQRSQELDPSGTVGNNYFYMFWEWNNGIPQNYSNVINNNSVSNNFFSNFVNAAVTTAVSALAAQVGSKAPTASDYAQQEAQLTADANASRKLLLVAHSQGNLFVNHAYNFILPVVGAARVKVVHVAPASVTLSGSYVLSANDIVINGLRLVNGFASIVDPNILPPVSTVDISGHGYSEIYLSSGLIDAHSQMDDRTILKAKFVAALVALDAQQCSLAILASNSTVKAGAQVSLHATLTPPLNDTSLEAITITYKWSISGTAGGTFNDQLGAAVTSVTTTTPDVVYDSSAAATNGQSDTVTVEIDVSTGNNNNATTKVLASTTNTGATIFVGQTSIAYTVTGDVSGEDIPGLADGTLTDPFLISFHVALTGHDNALIEYRDPGTTNAFDLVLTLPTGGTLHAGDTFTYGTTAPGGFHFLPGSGESTFLFNAGGNGTLTITGVADNGDGTFTIGFNATAIDPANCMLAASGTFIFHSSYDTTP